MTSFGFIGTGHIGSMLVRKFVETGAIDAEEIIASNRTPEKAERLAKATGIRIETNRVIVELSEIIIICVRPLDVRDVLSEVQHLLTPEKLLVSVAGDVSLKNLRMLCSSRVARAFPSMTSERLKGVTLLAFGDNADVPDKRLIADLFRSIGDVAVVDEDDFWTLADLTSCAPGYFAAIMREFALAAQRREIPLDLAERLVKQTMLGTAELLTESSFQGLISSVATRGGITEAGVKVIQRDAPAMFDQLFQETHARHEHVKSLIKAQGRIE
jgi:pyrroline-5-carboxylate reductase